MKDFKHSSEISLNLRARIEGASDTAAGGLIISKSTGNILIALRSDSVEDPETYGIFGGRVDHFESPEEALEREIFEETGYPIFGTYQELGVLYSEDNDFSYHTHIAYSPTDFVPNLNWEHTKAEWVSLEALLDMDKNTLHYGVAALLDNKSAISDLTNITNHYLNKVNKEQANEQEIDNTY
jgi:8-oxo-dGTP pyrophosphatase MutT (NUDIX family)